MLIKKLISRQTTTALMKPLGAEHCISLSYHNQTYPRLIFRRSEEDHLEFKKVEILFMEHPNDYPKEHVLTIEFFIGCASLREHHIFVTTFML